MCSHMHVLTRRFFGTAALLAFVSILCIDARQSPTAKSLVQCPAATLPPAPVIPEKTNVCLTPEFLKQNNLPFPLKGAATQMMKAVRGDESMEVPVKIALNGWTSADFHSYLAKVTPLASHAGSVLVCRQSSRAYCRSSSRT